MSTDTDNKMLKAKIELMTRSVFISTIALSVRHIITDAVETAATNNTTIFYNPKFIANLTPAQLAGLMSHEVWHIAFQHLSRRGSRDPLDWNAAGDYVINNQQLANGFELPPGGLVDSQYEGMSTDQVYEILVKQPKDKSKYSGMMLDIQGDMGTDDDMDAAANKAAVTDILVRAHTQAQIAGTVAGEIPGEILRVIDELINPKIAWETALNKFLDQRTRDEYSWARRNRRHSVYMPSLHSYGLGHLTFAIDTSGSVTGKQLTAMLSELKGIRDVFRPEKMTILDCDRRIHNVYEVTQDTDILSLQFTGGGGTRFQPVLDYVTENPTQALVYFTDLYGEKELEKVDYPILWICNSNHAPAPIGETIYTD